MTPEEAEASAKADAARLRALDTIRIPEEATDLAWRVARNAGWLALVAAGALIEGIIESSLREAARSRGRAWGDAAGRWLAPRDP